MSNLNCWIYIYFIKDDLLIYDRTVSRQGLGPNRAKQRVEELEARGYESFYTIGTLPSEPALS
jgi:hypothetical protein